MRKLKVILAVCALTVFGAGLVLGLTMDRVRGPAGGSPPDAKGPTTRPGSLTRELGLSPAQAEQFRKIWSEYMDAEHRGFERRRALDKEREEAVKALLSPEQKAQYEQLQKQFHDQTDELAGERHKAFDQAVERTKLVLNPEQLQKYEEMLRKRQDASGGPGGTTRPGGPRHNREGGRWPVTQPASPPSVPLTSP